MITMPRLEFKPVNRIKPESTWLTKHHANVMSTNGQDGLFRKIFELIGCKNRWCVEFGAETGKERSNTWNLINSHEFSGVLIEGNPGYAKKLKENYAKNAKVHAIEQYVQIEGEHNIYSILSRTPIPTDFDLCSNDINGNESQ
jgi:hypothetical protein